MDEQDLERALRLLHDDLRSIKEAIGESIKEAIAELAASLGPLHGLEDAVKQLKQAARIAAGLPAHEYTPEEAKVARAAFLKKRAARRGEMGVDVPSGE